MANSNKTKEKNPVLEEIENDPTPIEGEETPNPLVLEDILAKDPTTVEANEMDFLSEHRDDLTDEQKVAFGFMEKENLGDEQPVVETTPAPVVTPKPTEDNETPENKEKRYKAQQIEAQIVAERNRQLSSKVTEAAQLPEPTEQELKDYVASKGSEWDELTNFEKAMAKDAYVSRKQFSLVHEAVESANKIDEWAGKVDSFIESTDGKPEFLPLSGHEIEFRKFAMQQSHRGVELDVLLPAFLHSLPAKTPDRRSLFQRGGGPEPEKPKTDVITDADQASQLRQTNPREYARLSKAGKIKVDL